MSDAETVVVNIQGDEPFIQPEQIKAVMDCFPTDIATLAKPYTEDDDLQELLTPNIVKVVFSEHTGEALYFSRSVIPYLRGVEQSEWLRKGRYFSHIGLYAYRADVLMRITQLPPSALEQAESLEQLRWLENGLKIRYCLLQVFWRINTNRLRIRHRHFDFQSILQPTQLLQTLGLLQGRRG